MRPPSRIPSIPAAAVVAALGILAAPAAHPAVPRPLVLREPVARTYRPAPPDPSAPASARFFENGSATPIEFGPHVLLRTTHAEALQPWTNSPAAPVTRSLDSRTVVLRFPSATEALDAAARMATDPQIEIASPSRHRFNAMPHSAWGPAPTDPYFDRQWHLEPSRGVLGIPQRSSGIEFRSAWPVSTGRGVIIAFFDDGMDAAHPDLAAGFIPELARNWFTLATNAAHSSTAQYHGTAVAGLAAARAGNALGIAGAAPDCRFTGWVIFDARNALPETEHLAQAFEHRTALIPLQNHSWGNADLDFLVSTPVERIALSNAVHHGRSGAGTVQVRSAGNTRFRNFRGRIGVGDANLDAFANEPGAITVAGLRRDGAVASYSAPGACVLVAAPGGEVVEGSQLFTLDPRGNAGRNTIAAVGAELADYLFGSSTPAGTSFAAPLVTGLVAMVLDLQPDIPLTDLQRLLALASRPVDRTDPGLAPNAAGLVFSHNVGFGTPDPSTLLELVQRPVFDSPARPRAEVRLATTPGLAIPDDGLRVVVTGPGIDTPVSLPASGGTGLFPDRPTANVPLVDAGVGSGPLTAPVSGAAALMQRGPNDFADKIRLASEAGAAFAVIAITDFASTRGVMTQTDFARIPAVQVGREDGDRLRAIAATNAAPRARLELNAATVNFDVTGSMSLDWVQVRLRASHPRMGDLRITLRSPTGTISVLHRAGTQTTPMVEEWWYSSKRHLLEPSRGTWTLAVSDQLAGSVGSIAEAELILRGLPIADTDNDGLDDAWETARLGSLARTAAEDPDADGWSNAAEQFLDSDPLVSDRPLITGIQRDTTDRLRLRWPALPGVPHTLERAGSPLGPWLPVETTTPSGLSASAFLPVEAGPVLFRIRR